jgi:hypothetical protein
MSNIIILIEISLIDLTPAFAAGLERSGKPVRQHALVMSFEESHQLCLQVLD